MARKTRQTTKQEINEAAASQQPGSAVDSSATTAATFPIIGIGASAGGLAAFEAFLVAMPPDSEPGMAFVLVQHLAPDHKSLLVELIRHYTQMQVFEVEDGMLVQPNCTYVIPPKRDLALLNGRLYLLEPDAPRGMRQPIDHFFQTLAQDQHERAICIILSGTGSDGTLGARAIKGEGGLVIAQSPDSAEYDGMPRSVIAAGLADYVLPPATMPAQLATYVAHMLRPTPHPAAAQVPTIIDNLGKICVTLRTHTGVDFSQYKHNTVIRRIERRMAVHQIERPDDYLNYLRDNYVEVEALFHDLLIGVTSFFRDTEAFSSLQNQVIPRLFAGKPAGGAVRIWICGCSTGEEAYSIAILIREQLDILRQPFRVQIFATDVDAHAIAQARTGLFPVSIAADVTPERLARHFTLEPDKAYYRIQKEIRDMLILSEQDVTRDPPFSRLDMISCRNLLIYMNANLQRRLIPLFHYALNPEGILFLGASETISEHITLFSTLDRKWKIFLRLKEQVGVERPSVGDFAPVAQVPHIRVASVQDHPKTDAGGSMRLLTEHALLAHYAHVGVLVNSRGEVLHIVGRTGRYLEPAPGDAGMNILSMAREGLRRELTIALHRAVTNREAVRYPKLRIKTNGDSIIADLTVQPLAATGDMATSDQFLVILEERTSEQVTTAEQFMVDTTDTANTEASIRIAALEQELSAKEDYLQTTLEEMETSNEELKSINEELQSVNEELQSTNEELETSKEELQSVNEELATVNAELRAKVADLSRANNDMNNLLAGTGIGTLFVDFQLRIARFTPAVTQVINLIQGDVGRPVGHIVSNLVGYDRLVDDVQRVLDTLVPIEAEVQTQIGAWYLMRIHPYRTLDNVIEGAVITFFDVSQRKQAEIALRAIQDQLDARVTEQTSKSKVVNQQLLDELVAIYASTPFALAYLDKDLRYIRVNTPYSALCRCAENEMIGKTLAEIQPDMAERIEQALAELSAGEQPSMTVNRDTTSPSGEIIRCQETWQRIMDESGAVTGFLVVVHALQKEGTA